jgi:opacity protein-like surface antigen
LGAVLLTVVLPIVAMAQAPVVLFGGGGMVSGQVPNNLTNGGLGYNVLAGVSLPLPVLPLNIRIDGQFDQQAAPISVNRLQVYSATANAVYSMHLLMVQPYVIGGVGYYHILSRYLAQPAPESGSGAFEVTETSNGFGLNGGFGVKLGLGRVGFFGEWRYHDVFAPAGNSPYGHTTYAPFTLGVAF